MGFYGHIIKDPGQTQFYFDRKYSNLAELKAHETTDGIYVGRYVLVEYSEEFRFKGIALQNSNITKEDGNLYNKADGIIEGDFVCIVNDKAVYQCTGFSEKDEIAIFNFIYKDETAENIDYYNLNYNVDNTIIKNIGRGYDSTVWQKVYFDDDTPVEKYVMIAELNSVTPTFKIITDAPTDETKAIEVRGDSTNLNYNIVMPAVWGFNLKSIDYNIDGFNKEKTKVKNSNNEFKISDVNDGKKYPIGQSDAVIKPNTKELIINLPSIGNAISNVWDVVYGESLKEGEKRPLIPETLDRTKVGNASKIYKDNNNGILYRAVGEGYVELPADDNTGSLKALQLKMHHYLGTGEDEPSNNTIPGAINQMHEFLGNDKSEANFDTAYGAVKSLEGAFNKINKDWDNLKGVNDDIGFNTVYGSMNELKNYLGNENDDIDSNTVHGIVNRTRLVINDAEDKINKANQAIAEANAATENTKNAIDNANAATNTAIEAAKTTNEIADKARELIGNEGDDELNTIYGAINVIKNISEEEFNINILVENDDRVFISKEQKNSLFDEDDRIFYLKTEAYNKNEVDTKIADLIGAAPETLNTLEELAAALDNNADIVDALNGAIGTKQDKITGAATTIISDNLTGSKVLISDGSGKVAASEISNTELSYLAGVTSGIQTQINSIKYAGSSSVGGSANSAVKLDSSAGSATQPVYFSDGKPVATTYTLGKSVPSDAKFTDTTYTSLKNPHAITIQGNGTTLTNGVYDGSAAKTVNITPSSIGAAASSHNHNASNITSGVLPIERGGTGAATAAAARINLGIPKIGSGTSLPTGTELNNYAEGDIFFLIKG